MEEVFVLYDKKVLEKRFHKNIISQIQDIFVLYMDNILFLEYNNAKRYKIKKYIHSIASNNTHIFIIGNHKELPFEKMESPVYDDDNFIFTDNFWSSRYKNTLIPSIPVTRIPISIDENQKTFINKLNKILEIKTVSIKEKFGISASIWYSAASNVFTCIDGMGELLKSPKFSVKSRRKLKFQKYHSSMYFNLHGSKKLPGWYGQRKNFNEYDEEYPLALLPISFEKGVAGAFLLSEACYGGYIINKTNKQSIVMQALNTGMGFIIASTASAYGAYSSPLGEADLFIKLFIMEFQKGETAGKAFVIAKRKFAYKNLQKYGFLDGDDKKTLIEFSLFGNSLIKAEK